MKVLVTGAGGFIGRAATKAFVDAGWHVRGCGRSAPRGAAHEWHRIDLGSPGSDFGALCRGTDCIVHLAAHVHAGPAARLFSPGRFHRVNVAGTRALARAAVREGVPRLVFLSSIGVHGRESPVRNGIVHRFSEDDAPAPAGAYARSKLEAEECLREVARGTGLALTILRPPLVYGPGAPANFRRLLRAVEKGWPLPAVAAGGAAVRPERTLIYLDNLVDLILACARPAAPVGLFLAGDADFEVGDLVRRLAERMDRRVRFLRLPPLVADAARHLPVLGPALCSLTRPLLADSTRARRTFGWSPRVAADAALEETVAAYLRESRGQPQ